MTAASPVRRRAGARYRGVVYGWDVIDHVTGQVVRNDYIGQTRQRGRGRENQHRDTQPWADMTKGSPRVLWEGLCTDAELDEMERRFIQDVPVRERPRLNWLLNEDNPHQIPKWVQVEQRHQRDDAEGRPRWVPPAARDQSSLLEWDTPAPAVRRMPRRRWSSRRKHLTGIAIAWLLLSPGMWTGLAHLCPFGRWQDQALTAAAGTFALIVWVWLRFPFVGKRWRTRTRRAWRQLR